MKRGFYGPRVYRPYAALGAAAAAYALSRKRKYSPAASAPIRRKKYKFSGKSKLRKRTKQRRSRRRVIKHGDNSSSSFGVLGRGRFPRLWWSGKRRLGLKTDELAYVCNTYQSYNGTQGIVDLVPFLPRSGLKQLSDRVSTTSASSKLLVGDGKSVFQIKN